MLNNVNYAICKIHWKKIKVVTQTPMLTIVVIQNQNDVQVPLSKSGEVAQEFSKLLQDYTIEQQKRNQAEELASRELIEKLRLEEEAKLEQIKEKKLKTIKQDEKLARMLQEGLEKVRITFQSS